MAFALTLPLVGLEPRNFSALSIRLHCETIYESLCVSAQNSPNSCVFLNTDSNEAGGSGSGYATPGFKSDQKASQSSKNYSAEIERQRKEKEARDLRIMHQGRDLLNLAANIRDPVWKTREIWQGGYDSAASSRSIAQRLHEQQRTEDQTSAACPNCKFRQPKPYLY